MPHRGALVTALVVVGTLSICGAAAAKPVGFHLVAVGSASDGQTVAPPEPAARIVRDAGSARALFQAWGMDRPLRRAAPIDFRRRSLIVLIDGWMPDPGYVNLVGAVDVTGGTTTLTATLFHRGGGSATVLARPWAIVSVPRGAVAQAAPEVRTALQCVGRACRARFRS